jgi:hypothetical protein
MLKATFPKSKESNDMLKNGLKSLIAVAALAVLVSPAFAKPETRIITIDGTDKIAGKELKNDVFAFKVDDSKLVVVKGNKVVAEATGRWEPRDTKYDTDTVVTDANGQIQELRFAGEKRAFVISGM